jgi:signal transduction histidine kinase
MPVTTTREQSVCFRLKPDPTAPGRARKRARKAIFAWGLGDHADLVEIIISEVVTNAIRHGTGPVRTRISRDGGRLRIEVHDHGPGRPVWREPDLEDETGRGLGLIDGLIEPHGGERGVTEDAVGHGKTVHVSFCVENRE